MNTLEVQRIDVNLSLCCDGQHHSFQSDTKLMIFVITWFWKEERKQAKSSKACFPKKRLAKDSTMLRLGLIADYVKIETCWKYDSVEA